ncbi:hypothetical protein AB7Z98_04860 [Providencia manganoxydans]|uniref:hypothetical protein n=1 Tax=Providencia manganoxydans TaxID=2923283 RepID=UPI0034E4736D
MKKILLGLFLFTVGFAASADWKYTEKADEMRGTTQYFASLAPEKENDGVIMTLRAYSDDDKETYGFNFTIKGAEFDCKTGDICTGLMKADKGDIVELLFEIDKKNPLVADVITGSKFAQELSCAKVFYLEIPMSNRGMMQFKYEPNKLKWSM